MLDPPALHPGMQCGMGTSVLPGWLIVTAAILATSFLAGARAFISVGKLLASDQRLVRLGATATDKLKETLVARDGGGPSAGRNRTWFQTSPPDGAATEGGNGGDGHAAKTAKIRILSYNVLGPSHGLAPKHDHCPIPLRRWSERSAVLKEEIREYHEAPGGGLQAVCLQEVTPKTLGDTWIPFMKELGLECHLYQPKNDHRYQQLDPLYKRMPRRRKCLGVAIFYSEKVFKKLAEKRVYFPDELEHLRQLQHHQNSEQSPVPSQLEYDLQTKPDAAVMLRLQLREDPPEAQIGNASVPVETGTESVPHTEELTEKLTEEPTEESAEESAQEPIGEPAQELTEEPAQEPTEEPVQEPIEEPGRSITLVCCHLWFHPSRPDLKTAQCKLLFDAIERFHEECSVLSPEMQGDEGRPATNLVLCGDFNSVPILQPIFLPPPLRARGEDVLRADGIVPPDYFGTESPRYPTCNASASGSYALLAYGEVPASHPEHPDAFLPIYMAQQAMESSSSEQSDDPMTKSLRRQDPEPDAPTMIHHTLGDWTSGYGRTLHDVYRDRSPASPRFTTKTSQFAGIIDHVFVSCGEPGSVLSVSGVLGFPEGADMASVEREPSKNHHGPLGDGDKASTTRGDDGGKETEGSMTSVAAEGTATETAHLAVGNESIDTNCCGDSSAPEFEPIPDKNWGSDHLALGVELTLDLSDVQLTLNGIVAEC